ncbi:MAG: prefoldin subunit alpha [Candidatus Thermoplasmatota archaeon]|nr:prefoldin subunit alpha [Candidatus Thermoplasmatota archaeon]
MTNEDELTKYMAIIEHYKEQMNAMEMQASYVQAAIMDYSKTKVTLEQLGKAEKNSEVLFPMGGSTFINGQIKDPSKVLFDIGVGVVTEKTSEDAIKQINKRIEDLRKTQGRLNSMMQQIENEAAEVSQKAQRIMAEAQQGQNQV